MSAQITFACTKCGTPVAIDMNDSPNDDAPITCEGCGHTFGTYGEVKAAMVDAGRG